MIEEWVAEEAVEAIAEGISGEELEIDAEKGMLTITTDEGTMTTYTEGQVPPGFPFTVMPGAKVLTSTRVDPTDQAEPVYALIVETSKTPEEVLAFYQSEAESAGFAIRSVTAEAENAVEVAKAMEELEGKGIKIPMGAGLPAEGTGEMLYLEKEGQAGTVYVSTDAGTTNAIILVGPRQ
jgi:hypothetical protein